MNKLDFLTSWDLYIVDLSRQVTLKRSLHRGSFEEVTYFKGVASATKRSLRRSHFEKVKGTSEKRGKSKVAFIVTGRVRSCEY